MTNKIIRKTKDYLQLVRFSHTLFALPFALGSMWVAACGFPPLHVFLLILGCMVTARNSAMSFNRLADARIDALNPRTAARHLPANRMSRKSVVLFLIANGILFVTFAYFLNPLAFICSFPVWLILLSYSYWKRFSFLCHWFLGFAVGLSPLGAWIAVRGEFAVFPVFLVFILMLWMGGFDIIYAAQDEQIDRKMGLHSVPARFGRKRALQIAFVSHLLMLFLCVVFGLVGNLGISWWVVTFLMAAAVFYVHFFRKSDDLDSMNRDFFMANVGISVLVMIGLVVWVLGGGSADVSF